MSEKRRPEGPFTSFRIIGERAQKLLARARELKKKEEKEVEKPSAPRQETERLEVVLHLSLRSIVRGALGILAVGLSLFIAYALLDTLVLLFFALFLAIIIDPGVKALERMGVPRGIGVLLHYCVALFFIVFLFVSLVPIIADQIQAIAFSLNSQVNAFLAEPRISLPLLSADVNARLTALLEEMLRTLSIERFTDALQQFGQTMSTAAQGSLVFLAHLAGSVVNFVVNLIIVLVFAFFLQVEQERLLAWWRGFIPWTMRSYVDDKAEVIHWKLAQWARGQIILCLAIGFLVFLALVILRMPFALTLAILAGFTEFIPYVGPLIAAIPAVLIAWTQQGFLWALVVAAVYYVVQWCENNLIVPLIMKRAVGLSATAIILAMLMGVSFPFIVHPVLGIILSIPLATIITLFLEDLRALRKLRQEQER